jgi:hypothetical protein
MIKNFKDFDEELKDQMIYEAFDDIRDDDDDYTYSNDDIETPKLLSSDKFFVKIARILLNRFKKSNVGKICVHPTIINIDGEDGVYFYDYNNPSINIVICRNMNVKKAYLFKNFDMDKNKNISNLVLSTEKLGFTDIIDELIHRIDTNTIESITEGIVYEWKEGSFNYTEDDVKKVKDISVKTRQLIVDLLKASNPSNVGKNVFNNFKTDPIAKEIYDAITNAYKKTPTKGGIDKVIDIFWKALNHGGPKGTQYQEVLDVLSGCKVNGGPAMQLGSGGNNNTNFPEDKIDAQLEAEIAESLKKYEKDLKKIKNVTKAMCHYVKQNGNLSKNDISAMPVRGLLITGTGGTGKSLMVNKMLKEENMRENIDYFRAATGSTAPTTLFKNLYDYNRKLLIFDDSSKLFDDEDKISIWKAALDPDLENNTIALKRSTLGSKVNSILYDPGKSTRQEKYFLEIGKSSLQEKTNFYANRRKELRSKEDTSKLGIDDVTKLHQRIEKMIDAEWVIHEEEKEPLMPSRFRYNGVVIIISNDTREDLKGKVGKRHWDAITDRFSTRDLDPKPQAIWRKIKEAILVEKETDPSILLDEECMIPREFVDAFIAKVEYFMQFERYQKMTWRIVTKHMHNIFQGEIGIEDWEDELEQKMDTQL